MRIRSQQKNRRKQGPLVPQKQLPMRPNRWIPNAIAAVTVNTVPIDCKPMVHALLARGE